MAATALPSIRVAAAAQALGAPRVAGQRGQRNTAVKGLPGRAGGTAAPAAGRGITQHQAAPQRPVIQRPAASQHQAAPRQNAAAENRQDLREGAQRQAAANARQAQPKAPSTPAAFNPLQGTLNSQQLAQLAAGITKADTASQLNPLKQTSGQITGAEGVALNRYAGMGATGQQQLASLQSGEEASAKTAQNNAAEAAVSAAKEINTSGQSAQTANGGFLDPAVQQALAAGSNTAGALGGAAGQYAGAMGVSGANLMTGLRAAAAQRVTEGAGKIAQGYGAAQSKVANEEGNIVAKQPAEAKSLAVELGQKQFTDAATQSSLGIKQGTLVQKGQETAAKNKTAERDTQARNATSRQETAERVKATERGQTLAQYRNAENNRVKERGQDITQAHYTQTDKIARQKAEAAAKKSGMMSPAQNKLAGEFGSAYETIRQLREQKLTPTQIRNVISTGKLTANQGGKAVKLTFGKVSNPTLVQAAFEVWNYHKVSPTTAKALTAMGLTGSPQALVGL